MNYSKTKVVSLTLITLFFITIPFLQSLFFSSNTKGTIEVNKVVDANFIKSDKKVILLFFGYVGCQDVCTPLLQNLSNLYKSKNFKDIKNDIDVIFVNLTPEIEEFQPDLFAKFFNKEFKGIYLSRKEVLSIDRNFSLFFSQNLSEKTELNHTDYLYLITNTNDTLTLEKLYFTHPLQEQKLKDDIISLKTEKI